MTDTIGSARSAAESRLAPRWRRRALWAVIALAIAVVAVVHVTRQHTARADADWLQRQWTAALAADSERQSVVAHAHARTGIADTAAFAKVVASIDDEEAVRLADAATVVHARHLPATDLAAAARVVVDAFTDMSADLRAEAKRARTEPGLTSGDNTTLAPSTRATVALAADAVARTTRRYDVPTRLIARVRLRAAQADLDRLDQVTDTPVDVRLVLQGADGVAVWDLRTGRSHSLSAAGTTPGLPITPVMGGVVVGGGAAGYALLPLDGGAARPLPRADAYLAAGDTGVWRFLDGRVRRYDLRLSPHGPWQRLPGGGTYPLAASADAVVVQKAQPAQPVEPSQPAPPVTLVWWPATGRTLALPSVCAADVTAGRGTFVYADCSRRHVTLLDERTRHQVPLRPPRDTSFDYQVASLSADGRRLAVGVVPLLAGANTDELRRVAVIDTTTGASVLLPGSTGVAPQGWSPDGRTLVVQQQSTTGAPVALPLAYWHVGDSLLHSIRIDGSATDALAVGD